MKGNVERLLERAGGGRVVVRVMAVVAGRIGQAVPALDDLVETRPVGERTVRAKTGDGAVDEPRVVLLQRLEVDAQALGVLDGQSDEAGAGIDDEAHRDAVDAALGHEVAALAGRERHAVAAMLVVQQDVAEDRAEALTRCRQLCRGALDLSAAGASAKQMAELTERMMPGVISIPHGWGHHRSGSQLEIASQHAGVSLNDITDERCIDAISGVAAFNGQTVTVSKIKANQNVVRLNDKRLVLTSNR